MTSLIPTDHTPERPARSRIDVPKVSGPILVRSTWVTLAVTAGDPRTPIGCTAASHTRPALPDRSPDRTSDPTSRPTHAVPMGSPRHPHGTPIRTVRDAAPCPGTVPGH